MYVPIKTDEPVRAARRSLLGAFAAGGVALVLPSFAADAPPALRPPAKPTMMPAFELPTTAGTTLKSESLRGQVVVIRFWASW